VNRIVISEGGGRRAERKKGSHRYTDYTDKIDNRYGIEQDFGDLKDLE
jgi:hypothetical protein